MSCECNSNTETIAKPTQETRVIKVEFLYLDNETCVPCGGTSDNLKQAMAAMKAPLEILGIRAEQTNIHIASKEIAVEQGFLSSPTIRIDGVDIEPSITEDNCSTCGEIAGNETRVDCRTWTWQGQVFYAAPIGKIMEALLQAGTPENATRCAPECCSDDVKAAPEKPYTLPENLNGFFDSRANGCA